MALSPDATLPRSATRLKGVLSPVVTPFKAELSPDAERTLDWALASLAAHSTDSRDRVACQLLRAARTRLEPSQATGTSAPLAWH